MVKLLTRPVVTNNKRTSFSKPVSCVHLVETQREKRGEKKKERGTGNGNFFVLSRSIDNDNEKHNTKSPL